MDLGNLLIMSYFKAKYYGLRIFFSLFNFKLNFELPALASGFASGFGDGDWVYLAGGVGTVGTGHQNVSSFQKINVITKEVINLKDLLEPGSFCYLFKR